VETGKFRGSAQNSIFRGKLPSPPIGSSVSVCSNGPTAPHAGSVYQTLLWLSWSLALTEWNQRHICICVTGLQPIYAVDLM